MEYLNKVRTTQPIFAHRRSDLYSIITNEKTPIGLCVFCLFVCFLMCVFQG